jgi:hypothetical protein
MPMNELDAISKNLPRRSITEFQSLLRNRLEIDSRVRVTRDKIVSYHNDVTPKVSLPSFSNFSTLTLTSIYSILLASSFCVGTTLPPSGHRALLQEKNLRTCPFDCIQHPDIHYQLFR